MSCHLECSEDSGIDATSQGEALDLPKDACCVDCGYSLYGLVTARCPECGRTFDPCDVVSYDRREYQRSSRAARFVGWSMVFVLCLFVGVMTIVVKLSKTTSMPRETLAQSQVGRNGMMGQALRFYKQDVGLYPTTDEGLRALYESPRVAKEQWRGPYLEGTLAELRDPWGNSFCYVSPGMVNTNGYDLWSWGPDEVNNKGVPGSDDIKNWRP